MTDLRPGKIQCPSCRSPIVLRLDEVLAAIPIRCASCGLELKARRETSQEALDALERWYRGVMSAKSATPAASPSVRKEKLRRRTKQARMPAATRKKKPGRRARRSRR